MDAAEGRLKDQAEALTIKGATIDALLELARRILTTLEEQTKQGNKIVCSILALQPTEKVVQSAFSRTKKNVQHNYKQTLQNIQFNYNWNS